MTPAQLTELHAELTTDPIALGYAPYVAAGNDNQCAAIINALTGPGTASIALPSMTHDEFALLIAPVVMALGGSTAALQAKWTPMLNLISGVSVVVLNSTVMGMLSALSADFPAQLPTSSITAATTRIGSRAEVRWGAGTMPQPIDVQHAMGR